MSNTFPSTIELIARLLVYGLKDLAEEVKNAASVGVYDFCHFAVYDENGYGNEYVVEGTNDLTVVYGRLVEPDGGTVWQFRNDPDWEVPVPENACEDSVAVVEAILNIATMMPEYWEKTRAQRICTGTGSIFNGIDNIADMERELIDARWERAENPNVAPGCAAYTTKDIPGGQYGMVPVAVQGDDTMFVIEDQKGTGKVSLVMQGAGRIPAEETWIIIGPEQGKDVVYTFHPGEPVPRATTSTEELPVGTVLTKQEALAKGFNLAKVG
jgi:hypothetical protein